LTSARRRLHYGWIGWAAAGLLGVVAAFLALGIASRGRPAAAAPLPM
jgi:hypothetical protein